MRNLLSIAFVSIIFLGCSSTKSVTDTQPTQVIATSMDITKEERKRQQRSKEDVDGVVSCNESR